MNGLHDVASGFTMPMVTRRAGLTPERVAAMHLPVTAWATIETLMK